MNQETVEFIRVLRYYGPRDQVEEHIRKALPTGTKFSPGSDVQIQVANLTQWPQGVPDQLEILALKSALRAAEIEIEELRKKKPRCNKLHVGESLDQ